MTDSTHEISKAVVVLGFHRSGTSALAGALVKSGFIAAKTLIPSVAGENDKGFWESALLSRFNDDFLTVRGYSWDRFWSTLPKQDNSLAHTDAELDSLCKLILSEYEGAHTTIVVKDPRLCVLLPLWQAAFDRLAITPNYVFSLRPPHESARSLAQRNSLCAEHSMLLWLHYVLNAEKACRGSRRIFVEFGDLLAQPVLTISNILQDLKFTVSVSEQAANNISGFIDSSLLRNKVSNDFVSTAGTQLYNTVFALLKSSGQAASLAELDQLGAVSLSLMQDFSTLLANRDRCIEQHSEQLQTLLNSVNALSSELDSSRISNKELQQLVSDQSDQIDELLQYQVLFRRSWLGGLMFRMQNLAHRIQGNVVVARIYLHTKKIDSINDKIREIRVIRQSGLFDAVHYLECNPAVQWMMTEPLLHYVTVGHRQGFNPNPSFNELEYKKAVGGVTSNSALYAHLKSMKGS